MKLIKILFLLASFGSSPVFAEHGGSVSGGADVQPQMTAWFTSEDLNQTVKVCIDTNDTFLQGSGKSYADLKTLSQKVFQAWSAYYQSIGGTLRDPNSDNWNSCAINAKVRKGYRIATHFEILPACDQKTEDLTLHFGTTSADIERRKTRYDFPFAFSELNDTLDLGQSQAAWSKGFVWIAPPKSIDDKLSIPLWSNYGGAPLEMVLMHEIGHVFGSEHISGTIMDGKIGQKLMAMTDIAHSGSPASRMNPVYTHIDQNAFLVFAPENGIQSNLSPSLMKCNSVDDQCADINQQLSSTAYRDLVGMDLVAPTFTAKMTKTSEPLPNELPQYRNLLSLLSFSLGISGDGISTQLSFLPTSILLNHPIGNAFNDGCRTFTHNEVSVFGILGNKIAILNINSNFNPIEIIDPKLDQSSSYCKFYLDRGMPCALLSSDLEKNR